MKFAYIFGPPGVGKTTLMQTIRFRMDVYPKSAPAGTFPHILWMRSGEVLAAELGVKRDTFSGTDAWPMNVIAKAIAFVSIQPYKLLFAEGDRLANNRMFDAIAQSGYHLHTFYLYAPETVTFDRRRTRAFEGGVGMQNATWVTGRRTKCHNLAATTTARVHTLDATDDFDDLANTVLEVMGL